MADIYLNKTHKYFNFQTRIFWAAPVFNRKRFWEKVLQVIDELHKENDAFVYGLVLESDTLKVAFSTPYFNENILVLDWEQRLKEEFNFNFERPILCEPISDWNELKKRVLEMYRSQLKIKDDRIHWNNTSNSLKLIIDGHRYAYVFKDPLRVVFQPQIVFQIGAQSG